MKKIIIYKGSNSGFNNCLEENNIKIENSFPSIVTTMDKERKNIKAMRTIHSVVVVRERDYFTITDNANNTLLTILEEVASSNATVVLHNPQTYIEDELKLHYASRLRIVEEKVTTLTERNIMNIIRHNKLLTKWKVELLKTLLYFTANESDKPYVIVLYGGSGLGKTHIIKEVVKEMKEKLLSFQLSNYQELSNIGILLGERFPSKDIYSQIKLSSSSIILLDEFDKIHPFGYNAFYDLFDEQYASSDFVSVNIKNRIFIATTNFSSMDEIEAKLPNPLVNRVNKFIHVPDLSIQDINKYIDSKGLSPEFKEEVTVKVNRLDSVNLRKIDNIIEQIKIDRNWEQFIKGLKGE